MKMLIEIDTTNQENLVEVINFCNRYVSVKTKMAVKPTETAPEASEEVEVIPEPTPEKKSPKKAKAVEKDSVDLATLKKLAEEAVGFSDRATVKGVINEYGEKLSEVSESDYNALAEKLIALKG